MPPLFRYSPQTKGWNTTSIVITNGKGGVGKTSLVANLAGLASSKGIRTLAVDLDPQANLAGDFGVRSRGRQDNGKALLEAARDLEPLEVVSNVRPGVDLIPAGFLTRDLSDWIVANRLDDPTVILSVREAIATVHHRYDLILIDTPPAPAPMAEAGIHAAEWVLAPIRADFASIDGLDQVRYSLERMAELGIPTPRMLGVALFDVHTQSTAVIDEIRSAVEDQAPWAGRVFDTVIRRSERSALDMRRFGLLASEYQERSAAMLGSETGRRRIVERGLGEAVVKFSRAAQALANDYDQLGEQALNRMASLVPA